MLPKVQSTLLEFFEEFELAKLHLLLRYFREGAKLKEIENSFRRYYERSKGARSSPSRCPDQIVGEVIYNRGFKFMGEHFVRQPVRPINKNCIIIVLESPHKDEYDKTTKVAIGPANGRSGTNIKNHIGENLRSVTGEQGEKYDLILVNAIQYQTSLGRPPREYRNKIFSKIWESAAAKLYFRKRMKGYLAKYSSGIISNSCTNITYKIAGEQRFVKSEIRETISSLLKGSKKNFVLSESAHPCSRRNACHGCPCSQP